MRSARLTIPTSRPSSTTGSRRMFRLSKIEAATSMPQTGLMVTAGPRHLEADDEDGQQRDARVEGEHDRVHVGGFRLSSGAQRRNEPIAAGEPQQGIRLSPRVPSLSVAVCGRAPVRKARPTIRWSLP